MAMYGKRKKSLLSSFSTYHEDSSSLDVQGSRATYSRLPKDIEPAKQSLRCRHHEDDSIENLANEILDDISPEVDYISMKPSQKRINREALAKDVTMNALNKPLPQLPGSALNVDEDRTRIKRSALTPKSTNTKLVPAPLIVEKRKPGPKKIDKRLISPPLHLNPPLPSDYDFERPGDGQVIQNSDDEHAPTAAFTTAAAEDLGRKINDLIASANNRAAEKPAQRLPRSKTEGHLPGLLRGKEAFAKVRNAFADRFSPKAEKRPLRTRIILSPSLSNNAETTQEHYLAAGEAFDTKALTRRQDAERKGDGALKAQGQKSVVHTIRRKPLPIYDSMNTSEDANISPEDPFSDKHEIDFDGQELSVANSSDVQLPRLTKSRFVEKQKSRHGVSRSSRESKFVEAFVPPQENNTLDMFSSSPSGHSTPRVRLEPGYEPRNRKVVSHFSVDEEDDPYGEGDQAWVRKMQSKKSSTSLKRKKEEQEAGYNAVTNFSSKKLKRPTVSNEIESLATKLENLGTGAELQQPKNVRPKSSRGSSRDSFIASGLEFLSSRSFLAPTMARREAGTQGSFSTTFDGSTGGLEEKKVVPKQKTIRRVPRTIADMDIDELHMDLPEYRIASRMR